MKKFCKTCFSLKGDAGAHRLYWCGNCMLALYCGKKCQKKDWKGHRDTCRGICQLRKLPGIVEQDVMVVWRVAQEGLARRAGPGMGLYAADRGIPTGVVFAFIAGPPIQNRPPTMEEHLTLYGGFHGRPDCLPYRANGSAIKDPMTPDTRKLLAQGSFIAAVEDYEHEVRTRCNANCVENPVMVHIEAKRTIAPGEEIFLAFGARWWLERVASGDIECVENLTFEGVWRANMLIIRGDKELYGALIRRHRVADEAVALFLENYLGAKTGCIPLWLIETGIDAVFGGVGGKTCHSPCVNAGEPIVICAEGHTCEQDDLDSDKWFGYVALAAEVLIAKRCVLHIADHELEYALQVVYANLEEVHEAFGLPLQGINDIMDDIFSTVPASPQ